MTRHADDGLTATKLVPPTLPDRLVKRGRLTAQLDACLTGQTKLVLASAPAGSGKTTLLASWLSERPEASAWLQVEEGDSDPTRFWSHVVTAIATASPSAASLGALASGRDINEKMLVSAIVNEFADLGEPLVVVIDDYHLIDNVVVHESVERLIELAPATVTIVLSTRVDPPFRLGRLRVRGQMIELRGDDFRFDTSEASGLLSSTDEALDHAIVDQLCGRTEGWAAGLVLAGLSLRRSSDVGHFIEAFHGDDQLVVDYMTDEFLAALSDEQRRRLLETSVLEQFNGALVDAVTGTSGGSQWLLETAKSNQLLIGLDRTGSWYRYHHLLRDLLRLEAEQALTSEHVQDLHSRAAAWFEAESDHLRAIGHRLAAGEHGKAIRLMLVLAPQLILSGQIDTLRNLLERLGEPATHDAVCSLAWGWCDFIGGRYRRAEEWVDATHRLAGPQFDRVITAPLRLSLGIARGDVGSALTLAREMKDTDQFPTHGSELATSAGGVFMWAGQAADARDVLELALDRTDAEDARASHVLTHIFLAINDFHETGDASGGSRTLDRAAELGMSSYYRIAPAYALRARASSDLASARDDAMTAVELAEQTPGDLALAYTLTLCGDTLLDAGDQAGVELLGKARTVVNRCPDPGIAGQYVDRVESKHKIARQSRETMHESSALVEALTERETAVLRFLPTTLSQREIGSELFVSPNTVKTHCSAIYRKLDVTDRKAAVQRARSLGLL